MVVGANPLYTVFRAVVWAGLLVVIFKFVLLGIRVHGDSMQPTFHQGQIMFINRLAYLRSPPKRGDVVAIRIPDYKAVILKRVIALPGESLSIKRGEISVNGKRLEESYTKGLTTYKARDLKLEPRQYWLIGDNRDISEQYLKYDYQIMGKLVF